MQSVRASDPALEDYLELLEYNEWGEPSPLPQDIVRMDAAAAVAAASSGGATLAGRGTSAACYNWDGERIAHDLPVGCVSMSLIRDQPDSLLLLRP